MKEAHRLIKEHKPPFHALTTIKIKEEARLSERLRSGIAMQIQLPFCQSVHKYQTTNEVTIAYIQAEKETQGLKCGQEVGGRIQDR
ncbi:hypothetical protein RvY_11612 [Ramazzottius varieornatus]|uniref:Uncharacterized protein n=1 Tax=Ramazzottius varieornatus TaxID=947166 RepID=A0A1D1VJ43_RAMVA|nr:hypothetical protein RvY_11612 [Ramazzottius varieornatus]